MKRSADIDIIEDYINQSADNIIGNGYLVNKENISCYIKLIDKLIFESNFSKAIHISKKSNWNLYDPSLSMRDVDRIFFIWIGSIGCEQLDYFRIWQSINNNTCIYYDSNSFLASKLTYIICKLDNCSHMNKDFVEFQNVWFDDFNKNGDGNFDLWLLHRVKGLDFKLYLSIKNDLNKIQRFYKKASRNINFVDIRGLNDFFVFKSFDLEEYYNYELCLRNNLASASDIVRLIVLYKQGGMYIDFDTLPDFSHCFLECDEAYPDLAKLNISDVLKSEVILSKFSSKNNNIKLIVSSFFNEYNEYVESIMKAAQKLKLEDIFNDFVIPSVHFNLLSLSCAKNAFGEYNNNIIISHEKSKLISIIIMQMIKRYKFIIRCGALYSYKVELNMTNDDYFSRLINYRLDYIRTTNNVTLIVTGPSLILETLLGVSYKIFDIDDVEPLSVAVAFSNPNLKFAFVEQTQFTFEHMRSSWQANKNALTK